MPEGGYVCCEKIFEYPGFQGESKRHDGERKIPWDHRRVSSLCTGRGTAAHREKYELRVWKIYAGITALRCIMHPYSGKTDSPGFVRNILKPESPRHFDIRCQCMLYVAYIIGCSFRGSMVCLIPFVL